MVATSLDKILIERDEAGAIEYVKGIIRDLLMNKVDMSLLVVTKVGCAIRCVVYLHCFMLLLYSCAPTAFAFLHHIVCI